MTSPVPPEVAVVAATLRKVSDQQRCDADREELVSVAAAVEADWDGACCPVCQEVACDDDCPLVEVRGIGGDTPPVDEYRLSSRPRVVGGGA